MPDAKEVLRSIPMRGGAPTRDLSEEEVMALVSLAQSGDIQARNVVICDTQKQVKNLLRRYKAPPDVLEDMCSASIFGIIRAIEKYDASKGASFRTYAHTWIRSWTTKTLHKEWGSLRGPDKAPMVRLNSMVVVDGQEAGSLLDVIPSDEDVERTVASRELAFVAATEIEKFFQDLPEKHARYGYAANPNIVMLRAVLTDYFFRDPPCTLQEIGTAHGVTREYVRQSAVHLQNALRKHFRTASL